MQRIHKFTERKHLKNRNCLSELYSAWQYTELLGSPDRTAFLYPELPLCPQVETIL